jgi:hypothetical protein
VDRLGAERDPYIRLAGSVQIFAARGVYGPDIDQRPVSAHDHTNIFCVGQLLGYGERGFTPSGIVYRDGQRDSF